MPQFELEEAPQSHLSRGLVRHQPLEDRILVESHCEDAFQGGDIGIGRRT
jgi:hypothetical protein